MRMSSIKEQFAAALASTPYQPAEPEPRSDGWKSTLTGIGTSTYDKRQAASFVHCRLAKEQAKELWLGDDLAARGVETWPDEMLREGFFFKMAEDEAAKQQEKEKTPQERERQDTSEAREVQEQVHELWDDLDINHYLWHLNAFERAYGGGAILLGANDGQALDKPLRLEAVRSFDYMLELEPDELSPLYYYGDPQKPKYGKPSIWQLNPHNPGVAPRFSANIAIHESRLIVFSGLRVSRSQTSEFDGFGESILSRMYRVLRDFNLSWDAAAVLLQDFSQAVFKMKGLAQLIALDQDQVILNRMKAVDLSRSVARAILIDAEAEEFERKQTPLTGLPELLDRFESRLAAAAEQPVTFLTGRSPGGLNATGESDIRIFYDRVRAKSPRKIVKPATRITEIVLAANKIKADNWSIECRPLWQESQTEIVARRYQQAQIDQIYVNIGALFSEEVATQRFGGDEYSHETTIDMDARAQLEAEEAELEARAQEKAAEMFKLGGNANSGKPGDNNNNNKPPFPSKKEE